MTSKKTANFNKPSTLIKELNEWAGKKPRATKTHLSKIPLLKK